MGIVRKADQQIKGQTSRRLASPRQALEVLMRARFCFVTWTSPVDIFAVFPMRTL